MPRGLSGPAPLLPFCIRHRWEILLQRMGQAQYERTLFGRGGTMDVMVTYERCSRCGKDKAYLTTLNGTKHKVNADFVKTEFDL
jgi:hypothetical protein